MKTFELLEPSSIQEAIGMLAAHGQEARVFAGGTDLLPLMKERSIQPRYVVNLKTIPNLDSVAYEERSGLRIGPLVTLRTIETSPLIKQRFPVLAQAARTFGSVQIRHLATLAGNVCRASPAADMIPPLLVLDARARITGSGGERLVELDSFFLGPGQSILGPDEILTEILVPEAPPRTAAVYLKDAIRRALDLAIVGVAAAVTLEDGNRCADARLALGAVAPAPFRSRNAEACLRGQPLTAEVISRAAAEAARESRPISDVRGSSGYRKVVAEVLASRAIRQARNQIA